MALCLTKNDIQTAIRRRQCSVWREQIIDAELNSMLNDGGALQRRRQKDQLSHQATKLADAVAVLRRVM
jgi:hypothetical protein